MSRKVLGIAGASAGVGALALFMRYRRTMDAISDAVSSNSSIAETSAGEIEYAEAGEGEPMLVIHGAGGGYDQGLLIAGDFAPNYRVIAPSRFGYLKTPAPADFAPAAQADAYAALLDFLGIDQAIVVGVSAGAPSAIETALRHRERVSALVLLVPRTYHPTEAIGADKSIPSKSVMRIIEASADFLFWAATRVARSSVVRFLGVLPRVEDAAPDEERARVTKLMNSILPLSPRLAGIELDSLTEISRSPLEEIAVPVLIISTQDDLYNTLPGARFTAEHIRGAELHVLKSGGHLMVGQTARVQKIIADFLKRRGHKAQVRSRGTRQQPGSRGGKGRRRQAAGGEVICRLETSSFERLPSARVRAAR